MNLLRVNWFCGPKNDIHCHLITTLNGEKNGLKLFCANTLNKPCASRTNKSPRGTKDVKKLFIETVYKSINLDGFFLLLNGVYW